MDATGRLAVYPATRSRPCPAGRLLLQHPPQPPPRCPPGPQTLRQAPAQQAIGASKIEIHGRSAGRGKMGGGDGGEQTEAARVFDPGGIPDVGAELLRHEVGVGQSQLMALAVVLVELLDAKHGLGTGREQAWEVLWGQGLGAGDLPGEAMDFVEKPRQFAQMGFHDARRFSSAASPVSARTCRVAPSSPRSLRETAPDAPRRSHKAAVDLASTGSGRQSCRTAAGSQQYASDPDASGLEERHRWRAPPLNLPRAPSPFPNTTPSQG